jgi:hypothetical protein
MARAWLVRIFQSQSSRWNTSVVYCLMGFMSGHIGGNFSGVEGGGKERITMSRSYTRSAWTILGLWFEFGSIASLDWITTFVVDLI